MTAERKVNRMTLAGKALPSGFNAIAPGYWTGMLGWAQFNSAKPALNAHVFTT